MTDYQKLIWLLEKYNPNSGLNTISGFVHLYGKIDTERFKNALENLQKRNPILLNQLPENEQNPRLIQRNTFADFYYENLSKEKNPTQIAGSKILKIAQSSLGLENEKLFCNYLFQLSEKHCIWLLKIHHLLADGWSVSLIFKELGKLYAGEIAETKVLKAEEIFNNYLHSQDYQADKLYWKAKNFENLIPPNRFAYDSERFVYHIPKRIFKQLQNFCKQNQLHPSHFFLAALLMYLFRTSQDEMPCLGIPVLNRKNYQERQQIGLFINFLPFSLRFEAEDSLSDIVKKCKKEIVAIYRHQSYPLLQIYEDLKEKGQTGKLFDLLFSYEKHDYGSLFAGMEAKLTYLPHTQDDNRMSIHCLEYAQESDVEIVIDYAKWHFTGDDILLFILRLQKLCFEIIRNPAQKLNKVRFMPLKEYKIIQKLNFGEKSNLQFKNIGQIFEKQAEQAPEKTALIFHKQKWTYCQSREKALKIAFFLRENQCIQSKNEVVALAFERSPQIIFAMLGVMYAGGVFLILDINAPLERNKEIYEKSKCKTLLTDIDKFNGFLPNTLELSRLEAIEIPADFCPVFEAEPEDICYHIYTSGTSGKSKGIAISQQNLLCITLAWQEIYQTKDAISLQLAAFSFDVFIGDFCRSSLSGGTLLMTDAEERLSPEKIWKLITENQVSHLETTPVFAQLLWETFDETLYYIQSLRYFIVGSDILSGKLWNNLKAILPQSCKLINSYGLSECTIDTTYFDRQDIEIADNSTVPVGKPFPNQAIFVLDRFLKGCPLKIEGKIFIGGKTLGKTITEEEDNKHFLIHPIYGKLYETGDYGFWDAEAGLVFSSRKDSQVKIKGYRIELKEIEKAALTIPKVQQVCAFVSKQSNNPEIILAYQISSDALLNEAKLSEICSQHLPAYMLPRHWIEVSQMPLTLNGKKDLVALEKLTPKNSEQSGNFMKANTEAEISLIQALQFLFGLPKISLSDNFFALGGDSIKAIRLVSLLKNQAWQMSVRAIFENPTFENMAAKMEKAEKAVLKTIEKPKLLKDEELDEVLEILSKNLKK